jgi:riboflavin kinase / FMN adenylyltransferase
VQRWQGLEAVPTDWGHSVVTIGVFDGVHRGHAQIIGRAVERAKLRQVPSVLITFVPHPSEVVRPGSHPPELTTLTRRAELVAELDVDVFCQLPFTFEFSQLPADAFVHRALVEQLHAVDVVVGENFRFGHKAAGNVELLHRLGQRFGFAAEGVPLLRDGDIPLSATYVRTCVLAGDVRGASVALGRPHRVDGVIELGDQRGRLLGFPTAHLRTGAWTAIPADGVYAGQVWRLDGDGRTIGAEPLGKAAISVGRNPTFDVTKRRVEAHILDFDGDLYGRSLGVEFVERVRGQVKFDGVDALIDQMQLDVAQIRDILF